MTQKYTPTPWAVVYRETGPCITMTEGTRKNSGVPYLALEDIATVAPIKRALLNPAERDANAAFIVRACNSHDALVEALALCIAHSSPMTEFTIRKANEALALANGE